MQRALNYDAMPAIWVPAPFLLAAPCFALVAALLLAWHGEAALASRWTPVTLAITHLLVLGFVTMTIAGALLQLLPVVSGVPIPLALPVAVLTGTLLVGGTVLLAGALALDWGPPALRAAAALLGAAGFVFLSAIGVVVSHKVAPAARALVEGVRYAAAALAVTLGLGAALALYLGGAVSLPAPLVTDIHAGWGLVGWVVALTATVSFQVIPTFQATRAYPRAVEAWMPLLLFALLMLWSGAMVAGGAGARLAAEGAVALVLLGYAGATLRFLRLRTRAPDAGTRFWVLSMLSLVCAVLLQALPLPLLHDSDARPLLIGILVVAGCAMSAINGMLYKIVPFLVWYHLQRDWRSGQEKAPGMRQILDDGQALRQWRWHAAGLGLLLLAALAPLAGVAPNLPARAAGVVLLAALSLLLRDLGGAMCLYLRRRRSGKLV